MRAAQLCAQTFRTNVYITSSAASALAIVEATPFCPPVDRLGDRVTILRFAGKSCRDPREIIGAPIDDCTSAFLAPSTSTAARSHEVVAALSLSDPPSPAVITSPSRHPRSQAHSHAKPPAAFPEPPVVTVGAFQLSTGALSTVSRLDSCPHSSVKAHS